MQTQEQFYAETRATRGALIQEREELAQAYEHAKTNTKRAYIEKKARSLTMRIHFLSESIGELCPDCGGYLEDEEESEYSL